MFNINLMFIKYFFDIYDIYLEKARSQYSLLKQCKMGFHFFMYRSLLIRIHDQIWLQGLGSVGISYTAHFTDLLA